MIIKVADFVDDVYDEFKDKIPGLTKKKVENTLKNVFFCMSYNFARMRPMQIGEVYFIPNKHQCAFVKANMPIIGYKSYTMKQKEKEKLEEMEEKYKKSLESKE